MIQIVAYGNDTGSGNLRCICGFFCFLLFDFGLLSGVLGRLTYHTVVQLIKQQEQNCQDSNGGDQADSGMHLFFII